VKDRRLGGYTVIKKFIITEYIKSYGGFRLAN
jgi:hypothetical protein